MRIVRFIAVAVVLCVGIAGQSDAQKRPPNRGPVMDAEMSQQLALLHSLLDTFEQCAAKTPGGGVDLRCDVYQAQLRQTSLTVFLSPKLVAKLNAKLTAEEIEELKESIGIDMLNAYYRGKEKGEAAKR
jgi:hypothetical protein